MERKMSNNIKHNAKKNETKRENIISRKPQKGSSQTKTKNSPVEQVLHLQRTIGNRAVTRLIHSGGIQAELTNRKHNDIYEKEVDSVADRMISMKDSSSVQRQEPEEEVMPRLMYNPRLQSGALPEDEEEGVQPRLQRQPEAEEEEESAVCRVREKLTVGSPGDVYEQEADRVAEEISSSGGMSDLSNMTPVQQKLLSSVDPRALGSLSKKTIWPIVSKDTVGSKRLTVNRKKEFPRQNSDTVSANIENRILQSKGKGNQLPRPMQNYMAIQAGYDFSNVRVKADSEATELNTALGARAFANGSDIWLGRGEKATDLKLMAHELTHVVQQGGAKRLQTQSNALSRTLASKGFMPKFMQTLTKYPQSNSALFQKGILQFAKENPPGRMTALQARILDGSRSGMPNLRESAQTLRGCLTGCSSSSSATPTLKKTTVSGPTPSNCGGFSWGVQWSIDNATSSTNGWVVQKVALNRNVTDCSGNAKAAGLNELKPSWYPLWEAWQVRSGQVYIGRLASLHQSDTYGQGGPGDNTKGSVSVLGTAEYYDRLTLPSSFKVTNSAPTWSLPATTSQPTLTGGTGSLAHNLTATWDCCTSNKATTLATT